MTKKKNPKAEAEKAEPITSGKSFRIGNGKWTAVPNKVLETLMVLRLTNHETRIYMAILRKTWGYRKQWDWISLSQFMELTGLLKSNVCRALNSLVESGLVVKALDKEKQNPHYAINIIVEGWTDDLEAQYPDFVRIRP